MTKLLDTLLTKKSVIYYSTVQWNFDSEIYESNEVRNISSLAKSPCVTIVTYYCTVAINLYIQDLVFVL